MAKRLKFIRAIKNVYQSDDYVIEKLYGEWVAYSGLRRIGAYRKLATAKIACECDADPSPVNSIRLVAAS